MTSPDDLLIKRRRGTLRAAEEQHLQAAVRASRAYELSLHAGDAFDRAGEAAPGDAELVRALARNVEREWSSEKWSSERPRFRRRRRIAPLWLAVPLAFASAAAASYGSYRAFAERDEATLPATLAEADAPGRPVAPLAMPAAPLAVPVLRTPSPPMPAGSAPAAPPTLGAPTSTPATPSSAAAPLEPARQTRPRPKGPKAAAPLAREAGARESAAFESKPPIAEPTQPELTQPKPTQREAPDSARELFRRGQLLRQSDWFAAATVYSRLIELYPDSTEASIAELALGKWALARGRYPEAIARFRTHRQRIGSGLEAEALWGEARALDATGQHLLARPLWQQLSERYPASPYATVARERLQD